MLDSIPEENRSNRSSGNRVTRLGQIGYRKKPKPSSKATGVKIKLARIFKSLRYCLAKKKKGLIHSLVKSVTKKPDPKKPTSRGHQSSTTYQQCLTARANVTCYAAWATGQRGRQPARPREWAHLLKQPSPRQSPGRLYKLKRSGQIVRKFLIKPTMAEQFSNEMKMTKRCQLTWKKLDVASTKKLQIEWKWQS